MDVLWGGRGGLNENVQTTLLGRKSICLSPLTDLLSSMLEELGVRFRVYVCRISKMVPVASLIFRWELTVQVNREIWFELLKNDDIQSKLAIPWKTNHSDKEYNFNHAEPHK